MEKFIYWIDELGKEDGDLVGKKCANLGELSKIGLPIPQGFALSIEAYKTFIFETNAINEFKEYLQDFSEGLTTVKHFNEASKKMYEIIETKEIPLQIKEDILSHYDDLCNKCNKPNVAVSVRSAGPVSRPGQFETYLNVKGPSELLDKVKKVWSSTFNPRSLAFRAQKGLPLESDPIGIAILNMVNAKSAGVLFTADPNDGDTSKMIFEGNWGLGESVVGGQDMPDIIIIDKESSKVIKKTLGRKLKHVIASDKGIVESDTTEEKSNSFCVSDEELQEIIRLGKILENHFGVPQDLEWAVDQDYSFPENIVLLQARNVVMAPKKSAINRTLDFILYR